MAWLASLQTTRRSGANHRTPQAGNMTAVMMTIGNACKGLVAPSSYTRTRCLYCDSFSAHKQRIAVLDRHAPLFDRPLQSRLVLRPRASNERTLRAHASAASSSAPGHTTQQRPGTGSTGFKPKHVVQLAWALLWIGCWLTSSMNAVAQIGFACFFAADAASGSGLFPEKKLRSNLVYLLMMNGGCLLSLSGLLIEFARLSTINPQTKAIIVFGSLLCLEPLALKKLLELQKVPVMLCALLWYLSLMTSAVYLDYGLYLLYWYCAASSVMAVWGACQTDNRMQQAYSLAIVAISVCTCTLYKATALLGVKTLMGAQVMRFCFLMGRSVNSSESSSTGRVMWVSS